jgi:aspartate kinase
MVSVAVSGQKDREGADIMEAAEELGEIGIVSVARHMTIVSVVGHKMRNMVGVAGKAFFYFSSKPKISANY